MHQIAKLIIVATSVVSVIAISRKISNDGLEMFPKFYRDMAKEKEDKTDLVIKYDGYPVEIHNVTTSDGYILKCLRIPHGKKNLKASKEPVVIAPGFLNTAATFIAVSPERALPYLLADRGYDVWLLTVRGNPISSGHVKYTQKDSDYWNFSLDEPGLYDLPAIMDVVVNVTGKKQLSVVCLSFGCRYTYIMLTNVTGYNQKVHKVANMAPAVYVGATKSSSWATQQKLLGLINATTTFKQTAFTKVKTSIKALAQVAQLIKSHNFIPFDYGRVKNQEVYGTKAPLEFDMTKVGVPSMVIFSYGDEVVPPEDIRKFYSSIPAKYRKQIIAVKDRKFNHADFVFHDKVKELVYDYIVRFLEQNDDQVIKSKKDSSLKKTGGYLRRKT